MKRTWRKYRTKGSMTVEATFLFPMIFFIILAILNMAFYFCDMCKVQGVLDQYAKRQAVCTKEHRSLEKERDYEKIADTGIFWCMADNSQAEAELKAAVKEKIEEKSLVSKVEKVETGYCTKSIRKSEDKMSPLDWEYKRMGQWRFFGIYISNRNHGA